ncbi:MAG: hypothetical protein WCK26_03780 [Candidatus Saccharibacteria bacterium]
MNKKIQPKISPIEKKVMDKIKNGEAHMRPQSYYIFVGLLGVLSVIVLGFISAYFVSVASLWVRIQAAQGPAYGAKQNLFNMMGTFPWWALLLGVLILVCMILLVKKVGIMYKVRLLYLIPSIVFLVVVVGFLFSYSSLPNMFNGHKQNIRCNNGNLDCKPLGLGYIRNR